MATYAIGDLQGCYQPLQNLLKHIKFNPDKDQLWFTGDLVNRGPESLKTLTFVYELKDNAITVLGNHDLHLLANYHGNPSLKKSDTLNDILTSQQCNILCEWLQKNPLLYHHETLNFVLVHAGIYPFWDLNQAKYFATEAEKMLRSPQSKSFFANMYGNMPKSWSDKLEGWDRLRFIINSFTRMRFCNQQGELNLKYKGDLTNHPENYVPWFDLLKNNHINILFGHWAALYNNWDELKNRAHLFPLDSGCVWGNCLTAIRLEDKKYFHVSC